MSSRRYQYLVEGETEKKLINELKKELTMIQPGSVNVFNAVEQRIPNAMITSLSSNTIIILVFDTDTKKTDILTENIVKLKRSRNVKDIWLVMQVETLEDELIRSTDVKEIKTLIGCRSNSDFKRDMLKEKRLMAKLYEHSFDLKKMWVTEPGKEYDAFHNDGKRIKFSVAAFVVSHDP